MEQIETDRPTDIHKITVWREGSKFTLNNVYNLPWNYLTFKSISGSIFQKTIVVGDLNGHSPIWGYIDSNKTGRAIEDLCETTEERQPRRRFGRGKR